jgi:hypothetical protein
MHFETDFISLSGRDAGYTPGDKEIGEEISAVHQKAAELGGRVMGSIPLAERGLHHGIYITYALPDDEAERQALSLVPLTLENN